MILEAFSDYIKKIKTDIPAVILLSKWLREKISKKSDDQIEKVLQKELSLFKNKRGMFLIIAKSDSGRKLLDSLHEYALSYDTYKFSKWVHKLKASDFK